LTTAPARPSSSGAGPGGSPAVPFGHRANGRRIELHGIDIFRFDADGKVATNTIFTSKRPDPENDGSVSDHSDALPPQRRGRWVICRVRPLRGLTTHSVNTAMRAGPRERDHAVLTRKRTLSPGGRPNTPTRMSARPGPEAAGSASWLEAHERARAITRGLPASHHGGRGGTRFRSAFPTGPPRASAQRRRFKTRPHG
jgi:hypothetical protein